MVSLETLRELAWIAFVLGIVAVPLSTIAMARAILRGGGPLVWAIFLSGSVEVLASGLYVWVLYHLGSYLARHSIYTVLWFLIVHHAIYIAMGLWLWHRRARRGPVAL